MSQPSDVVEMEQYKNSLLLEMGRLQREMKANRESVFFLCRADRALRLETQEEIIKLHNWPKQLDEHMAVCEEKHEEQRAALEV